MRARALLLVAASVATTSCIWFGAVNETRPAPSSTVPRTPIPGTGDAAAAAADPTTLPEAARPLAPHVASDTSALPRPSYAAPTVSPVPMLGMLILASAAPAQGDIATVRLSLPVGTASGAGGLAALTAEVVAELAPPTMPVGSLRRALELQGASLTVTVDAATTAFEVVLPSANLRAVLGVLGERMAWRIDPNAATPAVDRLRQALARRLALARVRDPLTAMLANDVERDASKALGELNLRTAPEVALFQRARYRAASSLLALWVPGVSISEQVVAVRDGFLPWFDPTQTTYTPLPLATATAEASTARAVRWVERDEDPELTLTLRLPGPTHPLAAELMVLRECFSHDGVDGRLGTSVRALAGRGLAFDATPGPQDGVILRTRAATDSVLPLWEVAGRAQASLHSDPPSKTELAVAAGRARLRLLSDCADPRAWLRRVTDIVHRQGTLEGITACLTRLESPERLRMADALAAFAALPLELAVVGRIPATGLPDTVQRQPEVVLPPDGLERLLPPDEAADRERAAAPYVERAVAALGGRTALAGVRGYRTVATSDVGEGPVCEITSELLPNGEVRETRKILATTIETVIKVNSGQERASGRVVDLTIDEVRLRQAAAARHPLLLIARASRGELRLRLVSLRTVGDREYAVLEAEDDKSARLRLSIDTGSGLVRAVEMREWHTVGGLQTVVDEYEDYRTITGGRRTPFFRRRSLGDDRAPLRTTTTTFETR